MICITNNQYEKDEKILITIILFISFTGCKKESSEVMRAKLVETKITADSSYTYDETYDYLYDENENVKLIIVDGYFVLEGEETYFTKEYELESLDDGTTNVIEESDEENGTGYRVYDENGLLIEEQIAGNKLGPSYYSYTYDDDKLVAINRKTVNYGNTSFTFAYDKKNKLIDAIIEDEATGEVITYTVEYNDDYKTHTVTWDSIDGGKRTLVLYFGDLKHDNSNCYILSTDVAIEPNLFSEDKNIILRIESYNYDENNNLTYSSITDYIYECNGGKYQYE